MRDPGEPRYCARCGQPLQAREHGGRTRPHCGRCGWTYYAKNALGAALLILSDDGARVLLVQRAHDPYQGWWMLPAGFVEYGDSAWDTAVREATEETGLVVQLTGLRGLYFGTDDPRDVAHLAVYYARVVGGRLAPGDDACAVRFFGSAELPERIAFEAQRQALNDWRSGLPSASPTASE